MPAIAYVLIVALGLVARQLRVAILVDGRAVLVRAARANDAGQRGQRKAEVALHQGSKDPCGDRHPGVDPFVGADEGAQLWRQVGGLEAESITPHHGLLNPPRREARSTRSLSPVPQMIGSESCV